MTTYIDARLARELVEHCRSAMHRRELSRVFVLLGGRGLLRAIVAAVTTAHRTGLKLPISLRLRLIERTGLIAYAAVRAHIDDLMYPSLQSPPSPSDPPPTTNKGDVHA